MIVPARTVVPVDTFTPSRWAAESRPLREEAAPFFFDTSRTLRLLGRTLLGGCLLARRLLGHRRLLGRGLLLRRRGLAGAAGRDRGDLDHRIPLAVAPTPALVRLRLVREAVDLRSPGVADDPRPNQGRLELVRRREDAVAVDHQYRCEVDLTRGAESLDRELLALLHAVLLA